MHGWVLTELRSDAQKVDLPGQIIAILLVKNLFAKLDMLLRNLFPLFFPLLEKFIFALWKNFEEVDSVHGLVLSKEGAEVQEVDAA